MTLQTKSPEAVGSGNRAEIEAKSKAAIEGADNSASAYSLQEEAAQFSKAKRKPKAAPGHYVVERDGRTWTVYVFPKSGMPQTFRGLEFPAAHRKARQFSDAGYEGGVRYG